MEREVHTVGAYIYLRTLSKQSIKEGDNIVCDKQPIINDSTRVGGFIIVTFHKNAKLALSKKVSALELEATQELL